MIHDGRVLGLPLVNYSGTKDGIEALSLTSDDAGALAYAEDDGELGVYNGTTWEWGALADYLTAAEHTAIGDASPHHVRYSDAEASAAAPVQSVDGATGAVDLSGSYETLGAVATHAAITDAHHDPVTLAGAYDYLSIAGQQITLGQIDLTTDVTGQLPAANIGAHASTHESGGADTIDHDNLVGFAANEHIDHTSVTLTAGDG
ncbi:MAG: hypothetical protein GVY30_00235, partial [Chloroflexi bacterium]|nr:hypothetical protein [Chloroflexota bacterium]